jgi:hypothetical protein
MSEGYTINEVQIDVRAGLRLIAKVSSIEDLRKLLDDLKTGGFELGAPSVAPAVPESKATKHEPSAKPMVESPESNIETRAGLSAGRLVGTKVLAFKDGVPQLLRPGMFTSVSDATVLLAYSLEVGGKRPTSTYEDFKAVFDAQNIKTGTPLPMLLNNLKNAGYIDKGAYSSNRSVRLTAKGERKAEEVLKSVCVGQGGETG